MRHRSNPHRRFRRGITAVNAVVGAVLWCAVIVSAVMMWMNPASKDSRTARTTENGTSASSIDTSTEISRPDSRLATVPSRKIPDFTLKECMGGKFGLADLQGKPWVVSFIFTRCITTCPQITMAMKTLHDRVIDENPEVMFVTMTVDPGYDNATILQRYSDTYSPNRDRWKFLTGDVEKIHNTIVNGFGVFVKENIGDARRPGMEVAHSNRVILVNPEGFPTGKFLGTNQDDIAELGRILSGQKPFPSPVPPLQFSNSSGPVDVQLVPAASPKQRPAKEAVSSKTGDTTSATRDTNAPSPDGSSHTSDLMTSLRIAKIDRLLPKWAKKLPVANALLNSTAAVLLTLGWIAIRNGHRDAHRNLMISAFVVSIVFLGCYLTSHWALNNYTGERGRPFLGSSTARTIYYFILWPHVVLASTVPIFAIRVFQHAAAERWNKHRALARVAFPVWMYVSVTGVIIYGMLYHWPKPV
ncbi:MAG: DUF420 domain-containing protein [Fuerstiella sp.]|nr:DUF420 domain-containing protein [Fuerstiella sp.]